MENISLVISTLNRPEHLSNLLKSLTLQTIKNFEVIIVNQGNFSEVASILNNYSKSFPIKHIHMDSRGLSLGRNRGITYCKHEIIGFPDDDCSYPQNKIELILEKFNKDTDLYALAGVAYDKLGNQSLTNFRKSELIKDKIINSNNFLRYSLEPTFFIKKDIFLTEKFDEDLGVGAKTKWGSDEGPDLILRILKHGKKVIFSPSNIIYHEIFSGDASLKALAYSRGRGYLFRKHGLYFNFLYYISKAIGGYIIQFKTRRKIHKFRIYGYLQGFFKITPK